MKNNTTTQRRNNTQKRVKPTPVSLTKEYTGVSIGEVVTDLILIDPNVSNVFFVKVNDEDFEREKLGNLVLATYHTREDEEHEVVLKEATFDDMVVNVLEYVRHVCAPQLESKVNIHCSCNVASNRFYVRTEDGYAINVEAKYHVDQDSRVAVIDSYVVTYTTYINGKDAIANAEAFGYTVVERKPRTAK